LAFTVAPRLNAAGRIDDMSIGIQCLLADDPATAAALAQRLEELNLERREIESRMQSEALAAIRQLQTAEASALKRHGVCLYEPSWHQGIIGLVAGRIKDRLRRPVVAFATELSGMLRGSARSVAGIHIRDVLDAMATREPDLILRFGGHAMAAGLTLAPDKLSRFAEVFDQQVAQHAAAAAQAHFIETDGDLPVDELALSTALMLREAGPWGQAFPEPCFDGEFQIHGARLLGERHLKMWVEFANTGRRFDAIAFNFSLDGADAVLPEGKVRLVYRLDINEYQGTRRLQLLVDHVLPPLV
jgi:single-stranded-DNA-specific exonuclease